METIKRITIRYPVSMWKQLRRLQESGKIDSIQQITIQVLETYLKEIQNERSSNFTNVSR